MKNKLKNLGAFILGAYFLVSTFVMIPYYTYNDIKENDSFFRYFAISPFIGMLKGYTWPYHIYSNSVENKENELVKKEINKFFMAYDKYIKVSDNFKEWLYLDKNKDAKGFSVIFNQTLDGYKEINEILINTDDKVLNQAYKGLGNTKVNFQEAIKKYISVINITLKNEQDNSEIGILTQKADSKLYEVQKWLRDNAKELEKSLNEVMK